MRATTHASRRTVLRTTGGLLAAGSLAGCSGGGDGGGSDVDATVAVGPGGDFVFRPGTDDPLRVDADATVEFVWESDGHNVDVTTTPEGADWDGHDAIEDEGFSLSHTFTVPGRYEYRCLPHESLGMVGAIVVE